MALTPLRNRTADVPSLDGFRGLAVLWIILGHSWGQLGGKVRLDHGPIVNVFVTSYTGVDMLFIVSGFVLFLPVVIHGSLGGTKSYLLRRAARIVPAFYVAMIASYIAARYLGVLHSSVGAWVSHMLFLHTEAHQIEHVGFGTNGAMWTMAVEVMFYATLPIVATWYRRRPFVGLVTAIVISQLWHLAAVKLPVILSAFGISWASAPEGQVRMALAFPSYAAHFAIGMTCAWLFVHLQQRLPLRVRLRGATVVQAAAGVAVLGVLYWRGLSGFRHTNGPLDHWVETLDRAMLFGLIVLATSLAPAIARWPFENRVVRSLGVTCYGAYLAHLPVIKLLIPALGLEHQTTSNMDLLVLGVTAATISFAIGRLSYVLLEEPFRRWARRTTPQAGATEERGPEVALAGAQA